MTISAYSGTPALNTAINGTNIAEGCPPGNMNNMGREIMADIANGPIVTAAGSVTAPAYSFTGDTGTGMYRRAAATVSFASGGIDRLTILTGGNVGINQTAPAQRLDVAGNVKIDDSILFGNANVQIRHGAGTTNDLRVFTGAAALAATFDNAGNFTAVGAVTAFSDERMKTDIVPLMGSLAAIEAMQGVRFTRISDGSAQIGLIAQAVEAVRPEYVLTDEDGMKSLAYANIVADLIEAVKALSVRVVALEAAA